MELVPVISHSMISHSIISHSMSHECLTKLEKMFAFSFPGHDRTFHGTRDPGFLHNYYLAMYRTLNDNRYMRAGPTGL